LVGPARSSSSQYVRNSFQSLNEFLAYWDDEDRAGPTNPLPWRYWSEDDLYGEDGDLKPGIHFPAELKEAA